MTRGAGDAGLEPESVQAAHRSSLLPGKIQLYPAELYQQGMEVITVPTTRNLHSALNPAIKSLNYLNNILAKIEANNAGCEEAIMLNAEGFVAECTGDNIFVVKEGQPADPAARRRRLIWHHPPHGHGHRGQSGLEVSEPNLTRYDLFNADECFLTGTAAELMPVVKIDGRVIGTGKPAPLTASLMTQYHALTKASGEPIYEY